MHGSSLRAWKTIRVPNERSPARTGLLMVTFLLAAVTLTACGQKNEAASENSKNKVKEALEEAVSREFKLYEGMKRSVLEAEKKAAGNKEAAQRAAE
ncbi:MAG: hypothetical protein HY695_06545 [Deltaproteobacteria bacterium]|nr:hypothetical protein [Deltaproteobacteria bacterium]